MTPLIGLVVVWGIEEWVEPLLQECLFYCDETLVTVASHSKNLNKFEDRTLEVVKNFATAYPSRLEIVDFDGGNFHSISKATILNKMIKESKVVENGAYLWIRDGDEFYPTKSFLRLREMIDSGEFDKILVREKFFYINMQHYLKGDHFRLFKVIDSTSDSFFQPTQFWMQPNKKLGILPREYGMFHYSMLQNPFMKMEFWKTEYPDRKQNTKTVWLDRIYRNYDLNDQDKWIKENYKLFSVKSPWFSDSFRADKNGHLFRYDGKHPEMIERTNLTNIKDFRKHYGFRKKIGSN